MPVHCPSACPMTIWEMAALASFSLPVPDSRVRWPACLLALPSCPAGHLSALCLNCPPPAAAPHHGRHNLFFATNCCAHPSLQQALESQADVQLLTHPNCPPPPPTNQPQHLPSDQAVLPGCGPRTPVCNVSAQFSSAVRYLVQYVRSTESGQC